MDKQVRAMVMAGNGTNCEMEMAHACRMAGAEVVDTVSIYELLDGERKLEDYHFLNIPGGFLDGDDLGSAKAAANIYAHAKVRNSDETLRGQLERFVEQGKLILGICNGFQLLIKLGLVPAIDGKYFEQQATLTFNKSGRFENRWVRLTIDPQSPCVFTRGLTSIELPVRHGEGQVVVPDSAMGERLKHGHVALRYAACVGGLPTEEYPANPNGSQDGVAGLCDPSGRVFGMMPHPEAFLHRTNHPRWTRETLPEQGDGLALFINAVDYIRDNLLD
ncbi:MAG: phosphoribosylformylglycinamidine synthase subunit PurQ [Candidatus Alcyoniella australis]|nr:phosphoribosylformylglycinamidine synthase subunit PurQ [Candidatus Alcyoniella australis]